MIKKILTTILFIIAIISTANETHEDIILYEYLNPDISLVEIENDDSVALEDVVHREVYLLHPAFRNKIILLIIEAKKHGIDLFVSETYRTPERQNKFLRMGLTKLKSGRSKHQHGLAIDLIPVINGESHAKNHETLKRVGIMGEKLGLKWGGRWKFYDPVHFEWDISLKDLEDGVMPEIPERILIPDIDFFYDPKKNK